MFNVMLVDDENTVTESLSRTVPWKEFGFERIGTAAGGSDALEWMTRYPCHLLITDIRMPGMDGLMLLKTVRGLYPATRCIILSAYDEFEYAREALRLGAENYLLKPINLSEFIATVKDIAGSFYTSGKQRPALPESGDAFRENILSGWVSNRLSGPELTERASMVGINLFRREYRILCIKQVGDSGDILPLIRQMENSLSALFDCYHFTTVNAVHVFILGGRDVDQTAVRDCVEKQTAAANGKTAIFGTVGAAASGSVEVPASYQTAYELLNFNMLFTNNSVIVSDDFRRVTVSIPQIEYDAFCKHLHESTKEVMLSATRDMALQILDYAHDSMVTAKALLVDLLLHIVQETQKNLPPDRELPESMLSLFGYLDRISTRSVLIEWLCEVMEDARHILQQEWKKTSPVIRRVLTRIRNDYDQPLSIKTFSSEIGINPSYLGFLFKKETGMYFSDYLNQIRMDAAESLLVQSDLSIKDIAARTGYSDASYFSLIFQKVKNMSPKKYRLTNKR